MLAGERLDPLFAEHRIVGASWEDDDYLFDVEAYQRISPASLSSLPGPDVGPGKR